MTEDVTPFSLRRVPLGSNDSLPFEVAALQREKETWVVLRESRTGIAQGRTPVLGVYFEYVANCLRMELLTLRGLRAPLRFFHCSYEASARKPPVQWVFKEVGLSEVNGQYAMARWERAPEGLSEELSEALSLWVPPKRTCL